ncbi:MAG: C25 family cysteine peptidase [Bacteroidota bacterium]
MSTRFFIIRKFLLLLILTAFFSYSYGNPSSSSPDKSWKYSLSQESEKSILIEISIPAPKFLKDGQTGLGTQVSPGEGSFRLENGVFYGFSKTLLLPEGATVTLVKKSAEERFKTGPVKFLTSVDHSPNEGMVQPATTTSTAKKTASLKENTSLSFKESIELTYLGNMRGAPVSSLVLKPYSFDGGTGMVSFSRSITLRITSPASIHLREIANSPMSAFKTRSFKNGKKDKNSVLSASLLKQIPNAPDGFNYKIIIDKEGVVRVSAGELLKGGIPIESINTATLQLWNKGVEVPIYVYDRGNDKLEKGGVTEEYIEFFGEPNRQHFKNRDRDIYGDPETNENVYALTWGNALGRRLVEESGDIKITDPARATDLRGQSFKSTVFTEYNLVFERFGGTGYTKDTNQLSFQGDQFFWERVQANKTAVFKVELPQPDALSGSAIQMTAMLHGSTDLINDVQCPGKEEHNAEIYINKQRALKASWSGIRQFKVDEENSELGISIPMTAAADAEGSIVTVSNVFDCSVSSQAVPSFYVNWLQISYQRLYKAHNNIIPFSIPEKGTNGLYTFYISNFTRPDILIYRKGISRIINPAIRTTRGIDSSTETQYTLAFQSYVASPEEQFYAISEDQVLKAKAITKDKSSSLADATNDYDYIIITDTTLYNPLSKDIGDQQNPVVKLMNFEKDVRGFKVLVADINDINDEFNYGVKSKEAIRSFLNYAYYSWGVAPRYVLLAGDAGVILPDYWQTVRWGTTPTDYTYGFIDGYYRASNNEITRDIFPEILVGRIPATTKEEFTAIVDKSKAYMEEPDLAYYRSSAVLIAGDNPAFEVQSNDLVNNIPSSVSIRRVFVRNPSDKYFGGTSTLINEIDRGTAFINYMGHGGGAVWDDKGLLLPTDVQRMSNRGKYCVISSPTCFTGAYETGGGLLTAFIFEKDRGAIAAWGNSGYGWTENSYYFAKGLVESFFSPASRGNNIGDLFAEGKATYFGNYGGYDNPIAVTMLLQCNYLGDPALQFGIAKKAINLQTTKENALAGDDISFKGTAPFQSGQAFAELYDDQENSVKGSEQQIIIQNGIFSGIAKVPAGYSGNTIGIRAYGNDFTTASEAEGNVLLSSNSPVFTDVATNPLPVQPGQPFDFQVKVFSGVPVTSVNVIVDITATDGAVFQEIMPMALSGGFYRSTTMVAGVQALKGSRVRYEFEVITPGSTYNSQEYSFVIGGTADPAAYAKTPGDFKQVVSGNRAINSTINIYATPQGAQLGARIYNWDDNDAADVEVKFEQTGTQPAQLLGTTTISIPANSSSIALIPVNPAALNIQNIKVTVTAKPGDNSGDRFKENNSAENTVLLSCYVIAPGIGSTMNGSSFAPIGVDNAATLEVLNSGTVSQPVMVCMQADTTFATVQPGVQLLKGIGFTSVKISLKENSNSAPDGLLKLWYNSAEVNGIASIYKFNPLLKTWRRLPSVVVSPGVISAQVALDGIYAVGYTNDISAPNTTVSIEGQFFSNRGAVAPSPRISIVANDENGINTEQDNIILELDNKRVLKSNYTFIDSMATATSSGILYQPALSDGTHTFCVTVMDNNGNQSERDCIQMEVSNEFQVKVLGQFPNPFTNKMFLAYEILGANTIDEIEVKFFTASGRTIRRLLFPSNVLNERSGLLEGGTGQPTEIGYHEAWWDGTDEEGNEIANGIYFYRIRLRSGDKTIETLGKIARVR